MEDEIASVARQRASSHELKAEAWSWIYNLLAIPSAALAAAASITLVTERSKMLAAALAGGSAVLTALLAVLKPQEMAAAHHRAWARYTRLREDAQLLTDRAAIRAETLPELKSLLDRKTELDESSPRAVSVVFPKWLPGRRR